MVELNSVLVISFIAWAVAQGLKWLLDRHSETPAHFADPGGMPSSHAAVVTAAATVIGWQDGLDSPLFGLAVVVAAIVMHDAVRVRFAVGEQARSLNELLGTAKLPLVKVWKGHRIREVLAGGLLGVAVASALYVVWYG